MVRSNHRPAVGGNFVGVLMALILHRRRNERGWMSQWGSCLVPENAEARKKRIQKLLYSQK